MTGSLWLGNKEASVRWVGMPEDDVAAVLLIEFVSDLSECLDGVAAEITGSVIR